MYTITNDNLSHLTFRVITADTVNEALFKVYPEAQDIEFKGVYPGDEGLTRLWTAKNGTDIIRIYQVVRYF